MKLPIQVDKHQIETFCTKHQITKFSFFGSILTDRFGPESDIDVLVEFDPAQIVTLFDMVDVEHELSELLRRKVDLRTPGDISHFFRDEVLRAAQLQYAA